jgi:hypothetical protein
MLPQSFNIPGRRHAYVDLNDVFEMYALTGRFRDWVRRVVQPLLSTAVIEYRKEGSDPRQKNYAIAEANAVALIATLPEEKRNAVRAAVRPAPVIESPAPAPAARSRSRHHARICVPIHGMSNNGMYEPTSQGANRQLRRTAEYNEWREIFQSHIPARPSWLNTSKPCHIDVKFGHTAPHDTENLMKATLDTLFSVWRRPDNCVRSGSFSSEIVRSKRQGFIEIDIYQ